MLSQAPGLTRRDSEPCEDGFDERRILRRRRICHGQCQEALKECLCPHCLEDIHHDGIAFPLAGKGISGMKGQIVQPAERPNVQLALVFPRPRQIRIIAHKDPGKNPNHSRWCSDNFSARQNLTVPLGADDFELRAVVSQGANPGVRDVVRPRIHALDHVEPAIARREGHHRRPGAQIQPCRGIERIDVGTHHRPERSVREDGYVEKPVGHRAGPRESLLARHVHDDERQRIKHGLHVGWKVGHAGTRRGPRSRTGYQTGTHADHDAAAVQKRPPAGIM